MADENLEKLEMRISKIESLLEQAVGKRATASFSESELQAYQKVRDAIAADWGDFCGINDCFRCIIVRCKLCDVVCDTVCTPCDFECSCGPCNYGGRFGGRLRRFSNLG